MGDWHLKSNNVDLFFCVNTECNVITFRPGILQNNECPKCMILGSLVRSATLLDKGIRIESPKITESSKPA